MENKHTFNARIKPYFSPSDQLDIKLGYVLAKFAHRAQTRNELIEGKPTRYFEHVRRVSIVVMDELKIFNKEMIIASNLHDCIEDTDLNSEMIEHCFGSDIAHMVQLLSKCPKEGYIERLTNCNDWRILAIKACDRLDNLQHMDDCTEEFKTKQFKETKEKYMLLFEKLIGLTPHQHNAAISNLVDKIKILIN